MLMHFLAFYGVAAIIVGGLVSAMDKVDFSFRGWHPPNPRLWAGLAAGALWPLVVVKMIFG